ncbi:protein ecdysoneless homolog [Motacilla alba alba]|uniref:protein ecdysoneless homolog n=1 Tax=Motacilla alba alba TaxID=1094192 RepID=UPI0018D4DE33|nr:protein ecdysoneless homolog [Motacilla alba alba]
MEALRRPALPEDALRSRLLAAAGPGGEALLRRCAELALGRSAPLLAACVWQRQPLRLRSVPRRGEPGTGREARREEHPERGAPGGSADSRCHSTGSASEASGAPSLLQRGHPRAQHTGLWQQQGLGYPQGGRLRSPCGQSVPVHGAAEPPLLSLPRPGDTPAHLGGTTVFGDNVEDEWFIVYLLREISREFPGLAASIDDNAGEFLLIEAADFLPKWLNPENSENRLSKTCVTFTRCLYAQLVQQQFVPERRSGYTLPAPSHPQYRAHELGMKLAHGFEMLCSKSSKVAPDARRNVLSGPLWERFLRSLKEKDYFKGEMEGSAKYLELLHMAEDHFQQCVAVPESCDEVSPGDEILTLLETTPIDLKEFEREAACLPPEDDDSWLDITPDALDQVLKEARNESLPSTDEEEQKYDLETVAESMKAFVSKVSTHEGAEMPWSSDESHVTFDVDSFTKALDRILGADSEQLDSDDLDEEEEFGFSDEDDEDLDAGNQRQEQKVPPEQLVGSLKAYMKEMDRELAQTNVGKSFSGHRRGAGSVGAATSESAGPDCGAEAAELAPVDVDMNLVANLLESYSAQAGLAGPTSNILQSLGLDLPESTELTGS